METNVRIIERDESNHVASQPEMGIGINRRSYYARQRAFIIGRIDEQSQ